MMSLDLSIFVLRCLVIGACVGWFILLPLPRRGRT